MPSANFELVGRGQTCDHYFIMFPLLGVFLSFFPSHLEMVLVWVTVPIPGKASPRPARGFFFFFFLGGFGTPGCFPLATKN